MDAPNYLQRAACMHADSSSQNQLFLNGVILLNGNSWLQSFFCKSATKGNETSNNPLEQHVPNRVGPYQAFTSHNQGIDAHKNVDVDPSDSFQKEKREKDLSRTPPQKPRRKKYVPKVIKEGKVAKPLRMNTKTAEKHTVKGTYLRKSKENP